MGMQLRRVPVPLVSRGSSFACASSSMITNPWADFHLTQALEPLYTEGEPIEPYEWAGNNADQYDPEAQNAWGDLPMFVSARIVASIHCLLSGGARRFPVVPW